MRKFRLLYMHLFLSGLIIFSDSLPGQDASEKLDSSFLQRKTIEAVRISVPPKIDGLLDEPFWKILPEAVGFVEYSPRNAIAPPFQTVVMFAYDDIALYAGAILYDPYPDSICRELGRRDQIELLNTDYLSFDILPYNDALNMYEFKVSPANLQSDTKYSAIGADVNWDAVWQSATRITGEGWIIELRLPWSALRFPRTEKQVWGINMWRHIRRYNEWSTWSFVDNKVRELFSYYGELVGITHVDPPLRLSFFPYISGYVEKSPDVARWSHFIRGGLDVKYGINEGYTLDMMLIPDFGQVQSDDIVLNLSPFEIRYDEKRQFFTEATEMFDKCGIFYSHRVGARPRDYYAAFDSLQEGETIQKNPEETQIINATKISGRNAKGFGTGLFNAMTTNTWAILEDISTGDTRRIMTQPFTNYNVVVADQNLKNNSYITLINTNYWIPDSRYSANVTGTETRICNKTNTFAFFGRLNISQKYTEGLTPQFGYNYIISLEKPSGNFQWQLYREDIGNTYDPNDLGFLAKNNEATNYLLAGYHVFDPFRKILNTHSNFLVSYSTLSTPYKFTTLYFELNNRTTFEQFISNYLEAGIYPYGYNDYYEPRVWGYVYKRPMYYTFSWRFSSDNRKPFYYYHSFNIMNSPDDGHFSYSILVSPRIRFSDRFSMTLSVDFQKNINDYGWVSTTYDSLAMPTIYFGRRDISTTSNILSARYIFNTKTSLSLRARHYWSQANYLEYYTLNENGTLDKSNYWQNHNINFNAFTLYLQFIWYFAPGSELSVVWKNAIYTSGQELVRGGYLEDLSQTLSSPQSNSFSARILYYLDYLWIKKTLTRKKQLISPEGER